jgi:hypothetical protein
MSRAGRVDVDDLNDEAPPSRLAQYRRPLEWDGVRVDWLTTRGERCEFMP